MASYTLCPYQMLCFYQNLAVPTWGYHTGLDEWHVFLVSMEKGWGGLTWRTHCSKLSSSVLSSERGVLIALGRAACLYLSAPTLLCRWGFSRIHDTLCVLLSSRISGPRRRQACGSPPVRFPSHSALPAPASGPVPHPTGAPWIPVEGRWRHSILKPSCSIYEDNWDMNSPHLTMYLKHNC